MKNSADLGGCYPPQSSASVDNTLLDLQNSSYPTQSQSIIAKYCALSNIIYVQDEHNQPYQLKVHVLVTCQQCLGKVNQFRFSKLY